MRPATPWCMARLTDRAADRHGRRGDDNGPRAGRRAARYSPALPAAAASSPAAPSASAPSAWPASPARAHAWRAGRTATGRDRQTSHTYCHGRELATRRNRDGLQLGLGRQRRDRGNVSGELAGPHLHGRRNQRAQGPGAHESGPLGDRDHGGLRRFAGVDDGRQSADTDAPLADRGSLRSRRTGPLRTTGPAQLQVGVGRARSSRRLPRALRHVPRPPLQVHFGSTYAAGGPVEHVQAIDRLHAEDQRRYDQGPAEASVAPQRGPEHSELPDSATCSVAVTYERAPVAQLDRAPGFEPVGRGFKSLRAHQPSLVEDRGRATAGGPSERSPF